MSHLAIYNYQWALLNQKILLICPVQLGGGESPWGGFISYATKGGIVGGYFHGPK